jgi:hypothetical protein
MLIGLNLLRGYIKMRRAIFSLMMLILSFAVLGNPVFNAFSNQEVNEGASISFVLTNTAPDNGTSSYSKSGSFGTLTKINDTAVRFNWTAPYVSSDTIYTQTFKVSDINSSSNLTVNITVKNLPAGPNVDNVSSITVDEGSEISFNITCSIPDNGSTSFTLENSSVGTITKINDTKARFTWTAPWVASNKVYTQKVIVSDADSSTNKTFQITVNDVANGLYIGDLHIGGSSQERSNPEADDDADHNIYATGTFTIKNNEPNTINNVQVTWPSSSDLNISYVSSTKTIASSLSHGIKFSSLAPAEEVNITVRVRIPKDVDSFDSDRDNPNTDREFDVGDLEIVADSYSSVKSNLLIEAANKLEIYKLYVKVGSKSEDRVDDGDKVEKIHPGDKITMRLIAKNLFANDQNLKIEDVNINVKINEDSWDEDFNKDMGNINEDSREEKEFYFTVDQDADEDTYEVAVTLSGEDENGAKHGIKWTLRFEVEREPKDIKIKSAELDNNIISLCDNSLQTFLRVNLKNEGSDSSDEIVLIASSKELNLAARYLKIDLDSDDSETKNIPVNVPRDIQPGIYKISIYTYFDYDDYKDNNINHYTAVNLQVKACPVVKKTETKQNTTQPKENKSEKVEITTTTISPESGADLNKEIEDLTAKDVVIATPTQESVISDKTEVMLLIAGYIVVIFAGIGLIGKLLSK